MLFTSQGIINIRNKKWQNDFSPIDPDGTAPIDQRHSKAYLRHLFVCNEMLGPMIATMHNLRFYTWLVQQAREQIIKQNFHAWKNQMTGKLTNRL